MTNLEEFDEMNKAYYEAMYSLLGDKPEQPLATRATFIVAKIPHGAK